MTCSAHPTAVINIVALSRSLIGDASPRIQAFIDKGRLQRIRPDLPAVTCTVQSSMLTGAAPGEHGIVGNGWYNHEMSEVQFWKQSNKLVGGEKVWETAKKRDASVTCLKSFWWYNMYATADYSITPRPIYKADGRKLPDCYAEPPELRDELQRELGTFPLFNFWGPNSSIKSSQWIADATVLSHRKYNPTLTLVYLPHLDYGLQKLGPGHESVPKLVTEIDQVVGGMIDYFQEQGVRVMLLSEYGIEPVDDAVHINRVLRQKGLLRVRIEDGLELMDAGASHAFAVVDHQVAHVYVRDESRINEVAEICRTQTGVEQVLTRDDQQAIGQNHARSGDLLLVSDARHWFSYDYWLDDTRAPDFARTVDIHRKPGYDPLELFLDPNIPFPKLKIAWRLFQKKVLQQRALLDVIPLDTQLVRGSHGRVNQPAEYQPVLITQHGDNAKDEVSCRDVKQTILDHLFDDGV